MSEGRYVGHFWEQACPRCGFVQQWARRPEDTHCSGCRLTLAMAQATLSLSDLLAELDTWKARARALERQVGDLEDELNATRERVA